MRYIYLEGIQIIIIIPLLTCTLVLVRVLSVFFDDGSLHCNSHCNTINQACAWGEAISTSNCELSYEEEFTEERWELCNRQKLEDDCKGNGCSYIAFTEDAICAPFSKCNNAENDAFDPENACKSLDGCDWVLWDDDFEDAGQSKNNIKKSIY